jgi:hypothetical protein
MNGLIIGAAALLGAVVAWFAACAGGRHRGEGRGTVPSWLDWRRVYAPT